MIFVFLATLKKLWVILLLVVIASSFSFRSAKTNYSNFYANSINDFESQQQKLLNKIKNTDISTTDGINVVKEEIEVSRLKLKGIDIWLRYLQPIAYKKINGPLPVEWENEVFEKFEKPYKREGAGLILAELYLDEKNITKDSLAHLIQLSIDGIRVFHDDSVINQLDSFDHFLLCNRLYLLNLSAIYTTGFECPDSKHIIPELRSMIGAVKNIYANYNMGFPATPITKEYLEMYDRMADFVSHQPTDPEQFDHFSFIKDYVNPLFALNQRMINQYNVVSVSTNDFTLSNSCNSIFDKSLYTPQNTKGIYSLIDDPEVLGEIRAVGKKLFYDPLLSGNNARSCASCHKPKEFFTDTSFATNLQFDQTQRLARNTPSLVNVVYNHMLMLDGKHISLQGQGGAVMTNPIEMGGNEQEIIEKVLTCKEYKTSFRKFLKYTPEEKNITFNHIISAITFYYKDFSVYYSPFDEAMNNNKPLDRASVHGFNLFMSKAQCGTCHYVPQFSGIAPPFITSEFEVIGVPADTAYKKLSEDKGRYEVNPAFETMHAFRTNTVRNMEHTKPYMHNGVFNTIEQVIDFYDAGGGAGRKLAIDNQTLSADSLKLTQVEKKELISFIRSLSEQVIFEEPPAQLPVSSVKEYNNRKTGGVY
ncbi:MAG: cytochrome peroxidase [Flavipsychrobacter sp.]|nr:cytochrome peroxidase [Flavipsychrobacter sp.]